MVNFLQTNTIPHTEPISKVHGNNAECIYNSTSK